jgi:hypothetical protein
MAGVEKKDRWTLQTLVHVKGGKMQMPGNGADTTRRRMTRCIPGSVVVPAMQFRGGLFHDKRG